MSSEQSIQDSTNELDALRRELVQAKREVSISDFVARAARDYPDVAPADIRALVSGQLKFAEDGHTLTNGTELALFLQSKTYLQKSAAESFVAQRVSAVDHKSTQAAAQYEQLMKQKAYLGSLFGRQSDSKAANALFKSDPATYRRLRAEAIRLGVFGN